MSDSAPVAPPPLDPDDLDSLVAELDVAKERAARFRDRMRRMAREAEVQTEEFERLQGFLHMANQHAKRLRFNQEQLRVGLAKCREALVLRHDRREATGHPEGSPCDACLALARADVLLAPRGAP